MGRQSEVRPNASIASRQWWFLQVGCASPGVSSGTYLLRPRYIFLPRIRYRFRSGLSAKTVHTPSCRSLAVPSLAVPKDPVVSCSGAFKLLTCWGGPRASADEGTAAACRLAASLLGELLSSCHWRLQQYHERHAP